jgi:anti-sigma regulatory factor (Ser/Thr protein kinase)
MVSSPESLLLRFDSDITFVDYAVSIVDDLLTHQGVSDPTNVLIVVRELLKNAVVHGNRNDTAKPVTIRLQRLNGGRCRVEAEDDGVGFDASALGSAFHECSRAQERRGYSLIRALAERIEFNDSGNRVTVTMDL